MKRLLYVGRINRVQVSSKSREQNKGCNRGGSRTYTFLEKEIMGKKFFAGETIGFLDMVVGSMIPFCLVRGWESMGIDMIPEKKFPELNKWIKNLKEIEIVRECISHREKHIDHMKKIVERMKSA